MIQLDYEYIIPFATIKEGKRAAADSLPTAILYRNGAASGLAAPVATTATTGRYHVTFTTAAGWAKTDRLYLDVQATIDAEVFDEIIWDSYSEPDAVMRGTDSAMLEASYTAPANADIAAILVDTEVTIPGLISTLRGADDDTLKTLSDQIDGIASAGTGARTVTITITDGTNPLQNATVRMSEGANTYTALTSVSGVAVFNLDDATYVVGVSKSGYTFAGASLLVDGVETVTYAMTAVSVPAPSDPALCAVTIPIVNQHGVALVGEPVEIRFNEFAGSATTTTLVLSPPPVQVSDANGRVIVELLRLASYSVFYGNDAYKRRVDMDVPDAASFVVGE